jgi:hypothetical protein
VLGDLVVVVDVGKIPPDLLDRLMHMIRHLPGVFQYLRGSQAFIAVTEMKHP